MFEVPDVQEPKDTKTREIVIKVENGDELAKHISEIDALAKGAIGEGYGGLSIDSESVRIQVSADVKVNERTLEVLTEAIRTYQPPEVPVRPEPTKQELRDQLNTMQQQLDALRDAIEKLSDK